MDGHTEKLQLITFCDNWQNIEARALYTQGVLVSVISDLIGIATKQKINLF